MRFDSLQAREDGEQCALFEWAEIQTARWPGLALMFHIPNGGWRIKTEAARLKRMGVKRGVPDICLPVARGVHHGLFVELKRPDGGRASEEQTSWLEALRAAGYAAEVCHGWETAARVIMQYLKGGYECAKM